MLVLLGACGGGLTAAQQADVAADKAAQLDCIAKYDSGAEIDSCRAAVKAKR